MNKGSFWKDPPLEHKIYRDYKMNFDAARYERIDDEFLIIKCNSYNFQIIIVAILLIIIPIILFEEIFVNHFYIAIGWCLLISLPSFIYACMLPKKQIVFDRLNDTISYPRKGITTRKVVVSFEKVKMFLGYGDDNDNVHLIANNPANRRGSEFARWVIDWSYGVEKWSFYVWYMDKNRPLPPEKVFLPYNDKDFTRRKAAGFPKPLYFSLVPTAEHTVEQKKERHLFWKETFTYDHKDNLEAIKIEEGTIESNGISSLRFENDILDINDEQKKRIYPFLNMIRNVNFINNYHKVYSGEGEEKLVFQFVELDANDSYMVREIELKGFKKEMIMQVTNIAYKNLFKKNVKFEYFEGREDETFLANNILIIHHQFASEKIIDQKCMLKAHSLLNSSKIKVAIPKRGVMLLCSDHANDEVTEKFYASHELLLQYEDDDCLSVDIFLLENGVLERVLCKEE